MNNNSQNILVSEIYSFHTNWEEIHVEILVLSFIHVHV